MTNKKNLYRLLSLVLIGSIPAYSQVKDPAAELALIFTVSFMIFVIATLMYIIGVMNANVDPFVNLYFKIKNYVILLQAKLHLMLVMCMTISKSWTTEYRRGSIICSD